MKVLHLTGDLEDMGGILSVIRNLQAHSASAGLQHKVWVNRKYIEVRRPSLDYRFSKFVRADLLNHFALLMHSGAAYFELSALLKREHFDLIHAHTRGTLFVAMGVAKFWQRPVLFTNHSYGSRVRIPAQRSGGEHAHGVAYPQHVALLRATGEFSKTQHHFRLLRGRVFRAAGWPAAAHTESVVRLVGVGNIMRWKNWHLLARALNELTEEERQRIEFSLWGPRPSDPDSVRYDRELRHLVASSGVDEQFHFRGMTHSISDRLREADWFILPSTNEPCSVALIEALALGIPALASASGGNVDILCRGKTGLLFEPNNTAWFGQETQAGSGWKLFHFLSTGDQEASASDPGRKLHLNTPRFTNALLGEIKSPILWQWHLVCRVFSSLEGRDLSVQRLPSVASTAGPPPKSWPSTT
jgi:glycosyltransferase involved in cell wall biosynthesis